MINNMDYSFENISKLFEAQKKNLKEDILFLKEDILKDFRQIETKLNTKYEKKNMNIMSKLETFENTIKTMNNKIGELSSLITSDKDIQQKVLQLHKFKTKTEEDLLYKDILIKNITKELKDSINHYDKILSNSVIYPSVIGYNSKFSNFHELIDYILLNINQFNTYKEKANLDFKTYKSKIESLVKSIKLQADSIMTNTIELTNTKIGNFEIKTQNIMNEKDSKIIEVKLEVNKMGLSLENRIENEKKNILEQQNKQYDEELKNLEKKIMNKLGNYQNEIKLIKEKLNNLSESMLKKGETPKKKEKPEKKDNNTGNKLAGNGFLAKSIIKKYIEGGINIEDVGHPLKLKKDIFNLENNYNINLISSKEAKSSSDNLKKRMTLDPEKFSVLNVLGKNLININVDNSLDSENSVKNKTNTNNSISPEKEKNKDNNNNRKENELKYEEIDINKENKILSKSKSNKNITKEIINNENEIEDNYKTITNLYKSKKYFPKIFNSNNNDKSHFSNQINNKLKNKGQLLQMNNLNKMEENNSSNINNYANNKNNKTSIDIPDTYYSKYKNNSFISKLNIIEMNFKKANSLVNHKNKQTKVKQKIKECNINISSDKNNNNTKSNFYKKIKVNNSDITISNKSLEKIIINNNMGDHYYYNMMAKDDINNDHSYGYSDYIKRNKINMKKTRISLRKNFCLYNNIDEY